MDYDNIIKTINVLNNAEVLTNSEANNIILKCFSIEGIGATKNVKNLFRYFIRSIITLIKKEDIDDIYVKISNIYHKFGYNVATLDNFLSRDVRKLLKDTEYTKSIKLIKISDDDKKLLTLRQSDNLIEKHEDMIVFSKEYTLKLIRKLYESENMSDNLISAMLSSGSRPIEILIKSDYEYLDNALLKHKNLAKKSKDGEECTKPLLELNCFEFDTMVSTVRNKFNEKYKSVNVNGELKSGILNAAGSRMKTYYKNLNVNLYSCRAMYAILSYDMYKNSKIHGENPSLNLWIQRCLGHDNINISVSYAKYCILENIKSYENKIYSKFTEYNELLIEEYKKNKDAPMIYFTDKLKGKIPREYIRRWYKLTKLEECNNRSKNIEMV